jgi:hypothetical protein
MTLSAFADATTRPDEQTLAATLGRSVAAWRALIARLHDAIPGLSETWGYAGAAYGWSLRLAHDKRNLVYMTPCERYFLASFALGEKACTAARDAGLSAATLALIESAPRYAEGRGVRVPVRTLADVQQVIRLARLKLGGGGKPADRRNGCRPRHSAGP